MELIQPSLRFALRAANSPTLTTVVFGIASARTIYVATAEDSQLTASQKAEQRAPVLLAVTIFSGALGAIRTRNRAARGLDVVLALMATCIGSTIYGSVLTSPETWQHYWPAVGDKKVIVNRRLTPHRPNPMMQLSHFHECIVMLMSPKGRKVLT